MLRFYCDTEVENIFIMILNVVMLCTAFYGDTKCHTAESIFYCYTKSHYAENSYFIMRLGVIVLCVAFCIVILNVILLCVAFLS